MLYIHLICLNICIWYCLLLLNELFTSRMRATGFNISTFGQRGNTLTIFNLFSFAVARNYISICILFQYTYRQTNLCVTCFTYNNQMPIFAKQNNLVGVKHPKHIYDMPVSRRKQVPVAPGNFPNKQIIDHKNFVTLL